MVNPIPQCSICTRQNGVKILPNGTVEEVSFPNDPYISKTCPESYQCVGSGKYGCCRLCPAQSACPEATIGISVNDNACPDGYICDPYPVRCSVGQACVKNKMTNCTKLQQLAFNFGYGHILNGTFCEEGSAYIRNCPQGYYCPNAAEKIICPKGFFCPMKSRAPEIKCTLCQEGSTILHRDLYGFSITCFCIFVATIILYFDVGKYIRMKNSKVNDDRKKEHPNLALPIRNSETSTSTKSDSGDRQQSFPTVKMTYRNISVFRHSNQRRAASEACVLNNVSGTLRPNRLCAVLGESGAGKSTLISVLSGQMPFNQSTVQGSIIINGKEMYVDDWMGGDVTKDLTAVVPQSDVLYEELTVFENLFWSGRFRMSSHKSDWQVRQKVIGKLEMLGLLHIQDQTVNSVSGGERRRCSIGVALMTEPRFLVLDEPTSGLDSTNAMTIMAILKTLVKNENMTIFCSIHSPRQAVFLFLDDIILLGKGGKAVYNGQMNQVKCYFEKLGYEFPQDANPADLLLDISTGGLRNKAHELPIDLPNEWNKQQSNDSFSVHNDHNMNLVHLKELSRSLERPEAFSQLKFQMRRLMNIMQRDYRSILTNTFVICSISALLTYIEGPVIIAEERSEYKLSPEHLLTADGFPLTEMFTFSARPIFSSQQAHLKLALGTAVIVALSASKSMSDKKTVVLKEIDSGFSISAYFVALSTLSVLEHGCQMALSGILSYWLRASMQPWYSYVLNFFMLGFGTVSWAHLITAFVPPKNLMVIVGSLLLVVNLVFNTAPFSMEIMYDSKVYAVLAGFLSPVRYFIEANMVSDCMCLPQQYGFTTSNPNNPITVFDTLHLAMRDHSTRLRSCRGWYYGATRLLVIGFMIRAFTLLLIQVTYRRNRFFLQLLRDFNRYWVLQMTLSCILLYASVTLATH